jgi:L-amino acid N-acyltransferase YncA
VHDDFVQGQALGELPTAGCGAAEPVSVGPMTDDHAAQVLAIYQAGIEDGDATFETRAPGWAEFSVARLPDHRYVALGAGGDVIGWVAVSATSNRPAYAGVVEHSVYVHPGARGRGVGRLLLETLIASTEAAGIWTIQSGIFPENAASIALHSRAGFRVVGRRERIGRRGGRWRDVLLIERRSPAI